MKWASKRKQNGLTIALGSWVVNAKCGNCNVFARTVQYHKV